MILYIYILFSIHTCNCLNNQDLISETTMDTVSSMSIGLNFITKVNNTSSMDYIVELNPDQCCLMLESGVDCESMHVISGCWALVPKGTAKYLNLIAPLLDPIERYGYCSFYLDSHLIDGKRNVIRDEIKVEFDTRLANKRQMRDIPGSTQPCQNVDEDSTNDCSPVDCEVHYNGAKSFYSEKEKRCIETPTCVNSETDNLNIIYNPITNKCVEDAGITDNDLEYIKSLTDRDRHAKDILIIKSVKSKDEVNNESKNSGKFKSSLTIHENTITNNNHSKSVLKTVMIYLKANKFILIVLGLVILMQCCLICTMIYCLSKSCTCCKRKKVESKYFNYRQDVSATTPLIYTSNNETETTDYPFVSDSFNVDKKIKCYKACQRDRQSSPRMSLSDDILSKCLNRRKWDRVSKSDAIREEIETDKVRTDLIVENKVTFDNEKDKNIAEGIVKKEDEEDNNICNDVSEREIKCHTYNCYDRGTNIEKFTYDTIDKKEDAIGKTSVNSTEKGAQACFSNDSIDDFLSERGIVLLAENNSLSQSLQSSSGAGKSSDTSVSGKTSKNNIVRNVMSLLSRRSKSSSVPVTKKSKENLDLELIHMSRGTIFSSSSRSGYSFRRVKDSKTSF